MINVATRGVSAVKWSAASTVGRIGLQMVVQVFLARKLGPDIYGIFGIGMVVFTFSNFLATFGFGWALLQVAEVGDEDVRFAFTWQLVAGVVSGLALYALAPLLASYFHDPRVLPVIRWLSLACVLNAAAAPASNLLMRDLNFRASGLIGVGSYALGYIAVGIPLAVAGAGVNALVAAWLVQCGARVALSFAVRRHSLRLLFWYDRASTMFSIGSTVFVTNFANWFLDNLDRLLIGRLLNTEAVGLYNVGYNLATAPNSLLVGALQPAFFSASARMQDDPRRLGRAYLQVIATIWVLVLPPFVFLSVVAPDLVHLLYGDKWAGAGAVLRVLFLAMPIYITWAMSTPVLWNSGRKNYEALLQLPLFVLAVIAFYQFAPRGIGAAALVAGGLLASRGLVVGIAAFRAVNLGFKDLFPHLLRGGVLSIAVVGGALLGQHIAAPMGKSLITLVVASVLAFALAFGVVWAKPSVLGTHAAAMIVRFIPRLRTFLVLPDVVAASPGSSSTDE